MKKRLAAWIAAVILALSTTTSTAQAVGSMRLLVALTWEGRDLQEYNLDAVRAFREEVGDVPVVHFLSPAYFLRGNAASAAARIQAAIRPGDQVGLVVGGWKSLANEAKVIFRDGPTFWGEKLRPVDCATDCGMDVPLSVYPEADTAKLVQTGLATLEKNGFGRVELMSTEGYVATSELLQAAALNGIRYDFSAVAPEMLVRSFVRYPLYQWVKDLWREVMPQTQPFAVKGVRGLKEVPLSLAAVDYWLPDEALKAFRSYAEMSQAEPGRELLFPVAAYQETARRELPRLAAAIKAIRAEAEARGVALQAAAFPTAPPAGPAVVAAPGPASPEGLPEDPAGAQAAGQSHLNSR
jgi:hypothetical protein